MKDKSATKVLFNNEKQKQASREVINYKGLPLTMKGKVAEDVFVLVSYHSLGLTESSSGI